MFQNSLKNVFIFIYFYINSLFYQYHVIFSFSLLYRIILQLDQIPEENPQILNQRYVVQKRLGKGAYGTIFACFDSQTKRTVAIKQIQIQKDKKADMNEINLLKQLHHPNIVQYYDSFQTDTKLYIVMEYCEGGSLQQQMVQYGTFNEQVLSLIMYQVLKALEYLHQHGILHRDLKSANILCDKQMHIKLTDFGISENIIQAKSNLNQIAGSPYWIAKEVLLQQSISEKSDIWSLGATLYELINKDPPFYNLEPQAAMYQIMNCNEIPDIPTKYPEATEMIRKCFIFDVRKRPSAKDLLKETFITKWNGTDSLTTQGKKKNTLLLVDLSLSLESEDDSKWSDESDDKSQSDMFRRKTRQIIQQQQEISYAVQEQIREFIDQAFKGMDLYNNNNDFIMLFKLDKITDQTKQLSVFLLDALQRRQAIKQLILQILQKGLNDKYKQLIFIIFSFLFLNLQQQTQQDLYEQLLMNKYLQCMPNLNLYIQSNSTVMIKAASIFLEKIQLFTSLIPVFVSLGGIQAVFSQNMLYEKNRELAIQTIQCIYTISNQQNWNTYYIYFISSNKIYTLLLNTLRNLTLYSIQNDQPWAPKDYTFSQTNSDYDHRQLKEHQSKHFNDTAVKVHLQNYNSINEILKICEKCGQQQILSTDNVLRKEHLEFIYQLAEFLIQCYYIRNETKMSKQCQICQNLQQELQQHILQILMILQRIHQYVFKPGYPLFNIQQIVYQNLDKLIELNNTNQELRKNLVYIVFEIFTIDENCQFIKQENQTFFDLLISQKGATQYGVINRMAQMPIKLINSCYLQRILDYNIPNQIITFLNKRNNVISLYYTMLNQIIQLKNQKRNLRERYYYKKNYEKLVEKVIQNYQNQKLITKMCVHCYEEKNFYNETKLNELLQLMTITDQCSKIIMSQETLIQVLFKSLEKEECLQQHLLIIRNIYNQSDNIEYLLKDMKLELRLNGLESDGKTKEQIKNICREWLDELRNCKCVL